MNGRWRSDTLSNTQERKMRKPEQNPFFGKFQQEAAHGDLLALVPDLSSKRASLHESDQPKLGLSASLHVQGAVEMSRIPNQNDKKVKNIF